MVQKIKIFILFLISFILCFLALNAKSNIETNLLKTLLPQKISNLKDVTDITNKSASLIKVVFESHNETELEDLKNSFMDGIDKIYFHFDNPDTRNLLELYITHPANFLSDNTRNLLISKKYDEVYFQSIERLYNPVAIQLSSPDKDPYLLFDDFLFSNRKIDESISYMNDKYYSFMTLRIKDDEGLSPDLSNKKISELVALQQSLITDNSNIYLAGTPVHSFYTSKKSIKDINIICILSTVMIIFLTFIYFRNLKLLIPIALSISFGILAGFTATRLWFSDFQIITMVFSTTLIGIGIDYSYHYFFSEEINKTFIKNLSLSFLTTIIPFLLLYLTGIELLKQVAVFIVFGLFAIYLVVIFIYPCFKLVQAQEITVINRKFCKIMLIILLILGVAGFLRFKINDTLTALYSPSKDLQQAETLYNKVSGDRMHDTQIITVKGKNFEDIILKEEQITKEFLDNNIEFYALSKFLPSAIRQKENFDLVKDLYKNNLNNYSDILTSAQITNLKNSKFSPVIFDINDYPYMDEFLIDANKSMIIISADKKVSVTKDFASVINLKSDIQNYMKKYREKLLSLLPIVFAVLILLLTLLYDFKKALKIIAPTIMGIIGSIGLSCLILGEINLFSIITLFMILGFTIDYSIFRTESGKNTENAVFVSFLTTSFSFLLLSFCGFKLLSSMALILFFGILIAYLTGYILFNSDSHDNRNIKWFEVKEQSAGEKRLLLTWYLYRIFGKFALNLIAFWVSFFTFIFAPYIRYFSGKYFEITSSKTGIKPNLFSVFKHINSYANSLADKIMVYCGDYDDKKIIFENEEDKKLLFEDINKKQGVCFIFSHIGNIEILQTFLANNSGNPDFKINIFLSNKQSKIFNGFINKIKKPFEVNIIYTEDLGIDAGIKLKEKLDRGEFVFIAGDRISENNKKNIIEKEIFGRKINLPQGTFKLAKLMEVPTYFISAVKNKKNYEIVIEKQENLQINELTDAYVQFLERMIIKSPFQFFHFYHFFT